MKLILEQTLQLRKGFYNFLKITPKEELLKIPKGFNNNIWWNIAHVAATQQKLVYGGSGLQMAMPNSLVTKFQKGTTPDGTATDEEIEAVKKYLFTTIEQTIDDYDKGLFTSYKEYPTTPGLVLKNVDDAIAFNFFHEGLHMGSVFALRRAVRL